MIFHNNWRIVPLLVLFATLYADAFVLPSARSSAFPSLSASTTTTSLQAAAVVSNPFKRLPWVVQKEKEREARRMKQERAKLHRELGIAEDASYEEIVAATDMLIGQVGSDLKAKVKIEIAKDRILQIRLNERLAGLQAESKEARAMSSYELEGYVLAGLPICCFLLNTSSGFRVGSNVSSSLIHCFGLVCSFTLFYLSTSWHHYL